MRRRDAWLVTLLACAPFVACTPYYPPFTNVAGTTGASSGEADPRQATIVFLWPSTSCDPGGYYTLVTTGGRFIGNIGSGTQLRAEVPAGDTTIIGWNQVQEEAGGPGHISTVPVLRAQLAAGRTYYVRMLFGEWDSRGPRAVWRGSRSLARYRLCVGYGHESTSSAMEIVTPASKSWRDVPDWSAKLEPITPDLAPGQAWVDGQGEALGLHIAQGEERYERLRPEARRMATVEAGDGVAR
jgi:hypothetical protein